MKKVISFSIYGSDPKYTTGLLRNLELSDKIYPGWVVYIYYNSTVPDFMIKEYERFNNVELINMKNSDLPGMFWRFTPHYDVERFISRDVDSRLSMREKLAVEEWIDSNKSFHILRDHPHHEHKVNGGMFGLKINDNYNLTNVINDWLIGKKLDLFNKFGDLDFLDNILYDKYKEDIIVHDSVYNNLPNSKPFPTPMEDYKFIGEIYDENENRYPQYRVLVRNELHIS